MKGYWHLVDAILASLILMGFILAVASPAIHVPGPENMNDVAYQMLKGLNEKGNMRAYAAAHDYSGLDSGIAFYSHNHSVQICDYGGSCYGQAPSEDNVWVATYLLAGDSVYQPMTVRLFLWE